MSYSWLRSFQTPVGGSWSKTHCAQDESFSWPSWVLYLAAMFLLSLDSENCQHLTEEPVTKRAAENVVNMNSPAQTSHLLPDLCQRWLPSEEPSWSSSRAQLGYVQRFFPLRQREGDYQAFLRVYAWAIVGQFHQDCGCQSSKLKMAM